jgi:hypothetical protein
VIVPIVAIGAALVVCLSSLPAAAQQVPLAPQFTIQSPTQDPQRLQYPLRAPITLVPTITVSEEYNDNVLLDNRNRRWDLITGISPGLNFIWESRTHRLLAAYNFTAELYLRNPAFDNAFNTQNFNLDGTWRASEHLTLWLTDGLSASTDTNLIAPQGASSGRNRAFGNSLNGGAVYQFDEKTTVRGGGSWSAQRFARSELDDSDVYRGNVAVDRALSRQLRAIVGYEFAYLTVRREDTVKVHTPRIGFTWQVTPTITLAALGGPSFEEHDDGFSRITPAINATYDQRLGFGGIGLGFERLVSTGGALGDITDNMSVYGRVEVITLTRGLTLSFLPRYTWINSVRNDRIDLTSFTAPLVLTYRITAWMAAVARYQFFRQRTASVIRDRAGNVLATDADQDRLFVGMQFGYPITFDRP